MKDENKTKAQLLDELIELRQCVTSWEALKTNHERAKEALRESEARYSALIENIPVGLYRNTPGPRGRFIMANPAVLRMFGYDNLEEFLQTPVADLYWNPAERQLFSERLLAQEHVIAEEVQLKKRDGTVIWGAITASAIRDESGEVKYFDGMIQDISERKCAEHAQVQSKATVRALLDAPTDSAILLDSSGTVLAINETGAQSLGKSVEELVGKYIFDFLPPGVAESRKPLVLKASESGRPIRFEDERGGRFYDHSVYPVTDAQGKVVQVAIYTRDITDFKRAEARVRERTAELIDSEEKYRTIVENVPLVVYRIRPSGEILFVNQFVEEMFGYSTTEIFRNPNLWNEKVYDEDRARVEKLRGKSFVDGKEFTAEYRVKHKNGHIVYVVDHAIPFYSTAGLISSVDGIIMDVTHRVKLQEKLVRAEGLKTISEVSARLAHEIRNPLVSAGGFARRLLSSLGADDPNRAKVEIIVKEVGRLETILRMMLNYIQPIELEKSWTDLNQLIERALSEVGMEIREKNANVNLTLAPGLPQISVDRPQMELALETLAKQALNLMKEGETLSISTFQEDEMLKVVMRFPVQHMSADDVEHFFYPFATSRLTYNTADLPMSKTLVDKHGGVIDVSLAESGDLIIRISLPL